MELRTDKPSLNTSTIGCGFELDKAGTKTFGIGTRLRSSSESLAGLTELRLPAACIARKRKRIVPAGVSRIYPAFCTVTASGSYRRPAAGSFFCFGYRRLRLRFPSAMDPP